MSYPKPKPFIQYIHELQYALDLTLTDFRHAERIIMKNLIDLQSKGTTADIIQHLQQALDLIRDNPKQTQRLLTGVIIALLTEIGEAENDDICPDCKSLRQELHQAYCPHNPANATSKTG